MSDMIDIYTEARRTALELAIAQSREHPDVLGVTHMAEEFYTFLIKGFNEERSVFEPVVCPYGYGYCTAGAAPSEVSQICERGSPSTSFIPVGLLSYTMAL